MGQIDINILGNKIDISDLKHIRSVALLRASESLSFVTPLELRGKTGVDGSRIETIILEIEPEVPQRPLNDIRSRESVAVVVCSDLDIPDVLSLRDDFPLVPHTNLRPLTSPKSLCLYEDIEEARMKFAPGDFLETVRDWFSRTAINRLHQLDQPLEPFVMTDAMRLILPSEFADLKDDFTVRDVVLCHSGASLNTGILYCVSESDVRRKDNSKLFRIISVRTQPRTSGIINRLPSVFGELREMILPLGVDLVSLMRQALDDVLRLVSNRPALVILSLRLPRQRVQGGSIEDEEVFSILFEGKDVAQLSCDFGMCDSINGILGRTLKVDESKTGHDLKIQVLNSCLAFSPNIARKTSGIASLPEYKIALIGCGAIGSQLQANLARMGLGTWTFIDADLILPHNFARHLAMPGCEGFTKAEISREFTANLLGQDNAKVIHGMLRGISANSEMSETLKSVDVIIDATTSISASRELASVSDIRGRRISVFLNPSGNDAVLLFEDEEKRATIDSLEMQYYRFLMNKPQLNNHLRKPEGRVRYSNSCRDFSFVMPQSKVGTFAGILSGAMIEVLRTKEGGIRIWQLDHDDWSIKASSTGTFRTINVSLGEWSVVLDEGFLQKVRTIREDQLPDETGGVLLGCYDVIRKKIYLVDATASPEDSIERISSYVRGTEGLQQEIEQAISITSGQVDYIGEWHSHPVGCSANPSDYDLGLLFWIGEIMDRRGLPGIELIVADNDEIGLLLVGAELNSTARDVDSNRRQPIDMWCSIGKLTTI